MIHHAAAWRRTPRGLEILIHGGFDDGGFNHAIRVLHISKYSTVICMNPSYILSFAISFFFFADNDGHMNWIFPKNSLLGAFEAPELRHHNMVLVGNKLYLCLCC
jgi:hypothetical protein